MITKHNIVSIIMIIIFAVPICSCSDRSVVGTEQSNNSGAKSQRLGEVKTDRSTGIGLFYCIAINGSGDIIWRDTHYSFDELGFSLSAQQREMWKTYDVAVIDACDLGAAADHASTIDKISADVEVIILVTGNIPVNWSCLKYCAGASDYASCVLACMGKRPKRSN